MKVLAYRLQSDALGDIDKSIRRILRSAEEGGAGAPFDRRLPQTREGLGLKAGALLLREWNGKLERVMILEQGFAWNGQTFGSLSQIAKAMTGTNWNGHRFFGLREGKTASADASADRRKRTALSNRLLKKSLRLRNEGCRGDFLQACASQLQAAAAHVRGSGLTLGHGCLAFHVAGWGSPLAAISLGKRTML